MILKMLQLIGLVNKSVLTIPTLYHISIVIKIKIFRNLYGQRLLKQDAEYIEIKIKLYLFVISILLEILKENQCINKELQALNVLMAKRQIKNLQDYVKIIKKIINCHLKIVKKIKQMLLFKILQQHKQMLKQKMIHQNLLKNDNWLIVKQQRI